MRHIRQRTIVAYELAQILVESIPRLDGNEVIVAAGYLKNVPVEERPLIDVLIRREKLLDERLPFPRIRAVEKRERLVNSRNASRQIQIYAPHELGIARCRRGSNSIRLHFPEDILVHQIAR